MAVDAVIFDWGGTLTPWHTVDHAALWRAVCEGHLPPGEVAAMAEAIRAAEEELWLVSAREHRSATLTDVFETERALPGARPQSGRVEGAWGNGEVPPGQTRRQERAGAR